MRYRFSLSDLFSDLWQILVYADACFSEWANTHKRAAQVLLLALFIFVVFAAAWIDGTTAG